MFTSCPSFIEGAAPPRGVGSFVVALSYTGEAFEQKDRSGKILALPFLNMSTKNILRIQMCTLRKNELCQFLTAYGIHPEYKDIVSPRANPNLEYFCIHVSRLNPFGFAKLTNFAVMCKAYDDTIVPSECPKLLSKDNRWDKRSFKDEIPYSIHENLLYQRLGRYPVNVRTFPDPILFLAGLKPSWEHNDEDISFLPREQSIGFGTASYPFCYQPTNLHSLDDFMPLGIVTNPGQLLRILLTRGVLGFERMLPFMAMGACSSSRSIRQNTSPAKVESSAFLTISNDEVGLPDELLKVVEQMKEECEVLKEREKARDKECEELKAKCEAAMKEFDKNPVVMVLCQKIGVLVAEGKA
ncbi:hypothetical protein Tco_1446995 [Tanacetum coccineum]